MTQEMLSDAWDTHVHLFDPLQFPYKPDRAYTPPAASGQDLITRSNAKNFLLVQATIENGSDGLLQQMQTLQKKYPDRTFRATLLFDRLQTLSWPCDHLRELHEMGVRCLRIHGKFPQGGADSETIRELLKEAAGIARQMGWAVSAQLSLQLWVSLEGFIEEEMAGISIIAEHCASVNVPVSPTDMEAFRTFCTMLEKKMIYVKLGALHRRSRGVYDRSLVELLSKMAVAGPEQLLWGSDWPHVDSTARGLSETEFLSIDETEELRVLQTSMADVPKVFNNMLSMTPRRLFH